MTTEPETVEPKLALVDAARLLLENKFGCLPVVEGIHLVGILTEADFVKHMASESGSPRRKYMGREPGESKGV